MKIVSKSLADTEALVTPLLNFFHPQQTATVVALHGDLGAGKTAFAKMTAKILGIFDEVTSPTFVIEKVYEMASPHFPWKHFIHIDAYRLESPEEVVTLGWEKKIANPANLIFIEWPEKIADFLPSHAHHLYFTFIDETTRTIEIPG